MNHNKKHCSIEPNSRKQSPNSSPQKNLDERINIATTCPFSVLFNVAATLFNEVKTESLIDTGASVSVVPKKFIQNIYMSPTTIKLKNANDIPQYLVR